MWGGGRTSPKTIRGLCRVSPLLPGTYVYFRVKHLEMKPCSSCFSSCLPRKKQNHSMAEGTGWAGTFLPQPSTCEGLILPILAFSP